LERRFQKKKKKEKKKKKYFFYRISLKRKKDKTL